MARQKPPTVYFACSDARIRAANDNMSDLSRLCLQLGAILSVLKHIMGPKTFPKSARQITQVRVSSLEKVLVKLGAILGRNGLLWTAFLNAPDPQGDSDF